jgi:ABC-type phosphate transport system substrate-binding protein
VKRVILALGLCAMLAVLTGGTAVMAQSGRARAGTASATLTPSKGLIDLQVVHIAWKGMAPGVPVYIGQCVKRPKNVNKDCSFPPQPFIHGYTVNGADGSGTVPVQVHAGVGALDASNGRSLTCDVHNPCSFGVFPDSLDLSTAVFVPFTIAPSPVPCPAAPGEGSIEAQGAAAAFEAMSKWSGAACKLTPPRSFTYTLTDDPDAMKAFSQGSTDVAVSGFPLPQSDVDRLNKAKRSFGYAPLTLSGLVIAYNLYDRASFQQITNLKLTPRLITEIFTHKVFSWNCPDTGDCAAQGGDPAIHELNPSVNFPPIVSAFVPAGFSGQTLEFTQWMTAVAPDLYSGGPQDVWGNTGIPYNGNITPITDPNQLGLSVATGTDIDTTGYIGLMDSTTAALYGLPTVQLQVNGSNTDFVSPTKDSVLQGLSHETTNPDGVTLSPDYTTTDPAAWPMPYVSYAVYPRSFFKSNYPIPNSFQGPDGTVLRSFIKYSMSEKAQKTLPLGSYPLPEKLKAEALASVNKIPFGPGSSPASPPPPSPPPATTPPPLGAGGVTPGQVTGPSSPGDHNSSGSNKNSNSSKKTAAHFDYPLAAENLSSPRTNILVPLLAALAVLGILAGPLLLVGSRVRALAWTGLVVGWLGHLRRTRRGRRGGGA